MSEPRVCVVCGGSIPAARSRIAKTCSSECASERNRQCARNWHAAKGGQYYRNRYAANPALARKKQNEYLRQRRRNDPAYRQRELQKSRKYYERRRGKPTCVNRVCQWCGGPIPRTRGATAKTCSEEHSVERQRQRQKLREPNRRSRVRERYATDPAFRDRRLESDRKRRACNRDTLNAQQRARRTERYKNDPGYRDGVLQSCWEYYHRHKNDEDYQSKKRKRSQHYEARADVRKKKTEEKRKRRLDQSALDADLAMLRLEEVARQEDTP